MYVELIYLNTDQSGSKVKIHPYGIGHSCSVVRNPIFAKLISTKGGLQFVLHPFVTFVKHSMVRQGQVPLQGMYCKLGME